MKKPRRPTLEDHTITPVSNSIPLHVCSKYHATPAHSIVFGLLFWSAEIAQKLTNIVRFAPHLGSYLSVFIIVQYFSDCDEIRKSIYGQTGGKILWQYMKPLFVGKILYTPETALTRDIVSKANSTFDNLASVLRIVESMLTSQDALLNSVDGSQNLDSLQVRFVYLPRVYLKCTSCVPGMLIHRSVPNTHLAFMCSVVLSILQPKDIIQV